MDHGKLTKEGNSKLNQDLLLSYPPDEEIAIGRSDLGTAFHFLILGSQTTSLSMEKDRKLSSTTPEAEGLR